MRVRVPPVLSFGVALAVLLAPALPRALQTQTAPAQGGPVFRASTTFVEVDVMVRDGHDKFVRDLTANDLELYEDGKRQVIQQCRLVTAGMSGNRLASLTDETPRGSATDFPRMFVLVFDEMDLETSALLRIKQGARDFLNTSFRDDDYGGVVVNGRLYQGKLTRNRGTLEAGVSAVKPAFDSRETRLRPFRDFPRIPGESEAVRLALGDQMLTQTLGTEACNEDPFECRAVGGLGQVENKLELKARTYVGQARDATRYTLASIQNVVATLAALPGRKTVVFFSDGFFSAESTSELQQLAGMAARAGTAIYSIDGRGLAGGPPQGPDVTSTTRPISGGLDTSDDGPFTLANGTGAVVVRHVTDIAHALDVIANDTSTYYVLGYRPTNAAMDGKFRKISVKARAPNMRIRARTGYVATALPPLISK
jgi:VWFA-related protein